ncbi:MAG: LPS export ABC transporter permease LptF [Geobacteraceae bacterium]|nr:LPS export ABC transporter permease LptF [Geobacteraceae bacterium]
MPLDMKKTLHLYIFKEIIVPFLLGFAVFTFVLLMGRLINLAELVIAKGVPLGDVLRLLSYMLPSFSFISVPMSCLLAVLLAFGRLSADSEVTAMKAGGISLYGLLPPVIVFATLTYLITTAVTVYALPWGNTSFKSLLYNVINLRVNVSLKDGVFNDDFPGLVIYVAKYNQETHLVSGVLIYDERKQEEPATIFARNGLIMTDPGRKSLRLRLLDGGVHRNRGNSGYQLMKFASYDLSINFNQASQITPSINETDMSFRELREGMKSKGADARTLRELAIEFHRRLAFPFACFVFACIGIPLGLQNRRSGKSTGFSLCIVLLLVYYIFLSAGKTLGQKGTIPPALSMWLPNLVFIAIGIYLFKKTANEERIILFELPGMLLSWAQSRVNAWRKSP